MKKEVNILDSKLAAKRISENLPAIYGYAFARLYDKDDAEDLASEIVCEILSSAEKLKEDGAFWGFAWKIAENTFCRFLRKKELCSKLCELPDKNDIGIFLLSPEEELIEEASESEEIYLLRRELSLLAKTHREITVSYYIHGKSCSKIASEQNISVEMVKYYLFKTRKLLKEGIGMTRKLGEKSYNPGVFRLNFWGDKNYYQNLFDRKLPGAIVLAAYDVPMTASELSEELGVSAVYLEEELDILETAGILKKQGDRYQTNLVILTDAYEKEVIRNTASVYDSFADKIFTEAKGKLPEIRALSFNGNLYDDNRLLWTTLNIAMLCGWTLADEKSPLGKAPALPLGGHGWIFGHDNNYYENCHFHGVTMHTENSAKTAWFSAENYRVIERCQLYDHSNFWAKAEAMNDAVLGNPANEANSAVSDLIADGFISCRDGILSPEFPVFEEPVFDRLCTLIKPISEMVANCMTDISDKAETILAEHAPESVRTQCADIAKIHHRLDVAAFLMEKMVEKGSLAVPDERVNLCIFGVKKKS